MEYVISDTHFYHKNIINYCDRPFNDTESMNEYIIKKWNEVVTDEDVVYHLGDFAISWDKEKFKTKKECYKSILDKLNGRKILIKGNHDRESDTFYKEIGFSEVYPYLEKGSKLLIHYPIIINDASKQYMKESLIDFIKQFNINKYSEVIHGHIHNSNYNPERHTNVSVEMIDYRPVKLNNDIF